MAHLCRSCLFQTMACAYLLTALSVQNLSAFSRRPAFMLASNKCRPYDSRLRSPRSRPRRLSICQPVRTAV